MSIITLTTDFGTEDEYVGVMKGVILGIHPDATIIDITHHIPPQDLTQAAYTIRYAYAYFPSGTVHIVVVDPGVGSERPILALEKQGHFFLAPDNGVLSLLFDDTDIDSIVYVKNSQYFLSPVSQTFHGRDIFAPVGAHLSLGVRVKDLGESVGTERVERLDIKKPAQTNDEITGQIISIDRFGNLITNIESASLEHIVGNSNDTHVEITIGHQTINGLSDHYAGRGDGEPLAIIGSRGMLEISINKGNAQTYFMVKRGDVIKVKF